MKGCGVQGHIQQHSKFQVSLSYETVSENQRHKKMRGTMTLRGGSVGII